MTAATATCSASELWIIGLDQTAQIRSLSQKLRQRRRKVMALDITIVALEQTDAIMGIIKGNAP